MLDIEQDIHIMCYEQFVQYSKERRQIMKKRTTKLIKVFAVMVCIVSVFAFAAVNSLFGINKNTALADVEQEVVILDKPEDFYIEDNTIYGLSVLGYSKLGLTEPDADSTEFLTNSSRT